MTLKNTCLRSETQTSPPRRYYGFSIFKVRPNQIVQNLLRSGEVRPTKQTTFNDNIPRRRVAFINVFVLFVVTTFSSFAQTPQVGESASKRFVSIETDPAFWVGTVPNGPCFDANVDFRLAKHPKLRFGVLLYSGRWSGEFGKTVVLTEDFSENNWQTQWNGVGIEAQYQLRFGLRRGGLQPGLRVQWNQFIYHRENIRKAEADHGVLTPQLGFQWFPFKTLGVYLLPWAGAQLPILGSNTVNIEGLNKGTRKVMVVVTAHIGWEFSF